MGSQSVAKNLFVSQFRWLSALPLLIVIALLVVISLTTLSSTNARTGGLREDVFDFFQRVSPASERSASEFHIIHIDAESIERVGPWPWPRSLIADLTTEAKEAGASGVVYAEPVDAKDPLSPETIGDFWLSGARDNALASQLALLPATDLMLARSISQTNGIITAAPGASGDRLGRADFSKSDFISVTTGSSDFVGLPSAQVRLPIKRELANAATLSVASLPTDDDGVFRALPIIWEVDGTPVLATAAAAARTALGIDGIIVDVAGTAVTSSGSSITGITFDETHFDLTDMATLRFFPSRRLDVETTPAWRLLQTDTPLPQLENKVVMIGLDGDIGQTVRTSRGKFSTVELHTLLAGQIADGVAASRPAWIGYIEALSVMLLGALAIMWSQRFDFWKALGVAAIVSAIVFLSCYGMFSLNHTLVNPIPGIAALFLGAFSVAGGRTLGVVLKDDNVRGSFQGSLPEPAMKRLRENSDTDLLVGTHRDITVLACELRFLEADLQKAKDASSALTNVMATASQSLKDAIIETGGAVDQADGGKIYGYFNAPMETADHVRAGCSSALRLVESLDKINAELEASTRLHGIQIHLAVGIATGSCLVGPMGHGRTNRYSAIGPAVEMATFLRKQAEKYGPAIICDETVYRQTHHHFAFLELDQFATSKQERAFSIHALVGNPFIKSSKSYRSLEDAHRKMLTAYREGDFAGAQNFLAEARKSPGARIALFDIYEQRLMEWSGAEKPADWDPTEIVSV